MPSVEFLNFGPAETLNFGILHFGLSESHRAMRVWTRCWPKFNISVLPKCETPKFKVSAGPKFKNSTLGISRIPKFYSKLIISAVPTCSQYSNFRQSRNINQVFKFRLVQKSYPNLDF